MTAAESLHRATVSKGSARLVLIATDWRQHVGLIRTVYPEIIIVNSTAKEISEALLVRPLPAQPAGSSLPGFLAWFAFAWQRRSGPKSYEAL